MTRPVAAEILVLNEHEPIPVPDDSTLYVTASLSVRDALLRDGAQAVYRSPAGPEPDLRTARTLSLPSGTLFLDLGRFDGPDRVVALTPQQRALTWAMSDGEWHTPEELDRALGRAAGDRARLDSALTRLRRKLGGCIDSAYGGGWRLRQVGAPRPAPTLLDLLSTDAPVPPRSLSRRLGCTPGALRARVHRLRRAGVQIVRAPDGYVLRDEQESLHQAIADALRQHRVVNLWGPLGVGKSTLVRQLTGARVLALEGLDPDRIRRRLQGLSPGPVVLDGLNPDALRALDLLGSRQVLFTTRAPVPGVAQVAYLPWSAERLGREFPGVDSSAWDGLPLGSCSDAAILARLPDDPALREAAREPSPLHLGNLGAAADRLARLGVLVGAPGTRIAGPVLRALRSTFTSDEWQDLGQRLTDRLRDLFWRQDLDPDSPIAREGLEVLAELERRDLPRSGLAMVLADADALTDGTALAALADRPGPDRPDVLYRLWLTGAGDPHLRLAIELAEPPDRYDLMVQLAHDLYPRAQPEAERLFDEVRAWLDGSEPHEHVWVRNEWLISVGLRQPRRIEPEQLITQLMALERARFGHPFAKMQWARVNCLWALGVCAMIRDDLDTAINALEEVVARMGDRSVLHGGVELVRAYTRRRDWALADALVARIRDYPLNQAWADHRRHAHAMLLIGQGRWEAAADVAAPLDPTHPRTGLAPGLLRAVEGVDPAPGSPHAGALSAVARACRSRDPLHLDAVRALPTEIAYSGPELARAVEICPLRAQNTQ